MGDAVDSPGQSEDRPAEVAEVWAGEASQESGVKVFPLGAGEVSGGETGRTEERFDVGACGISGDCYRAVKKMRKLKNSGVQSAASRSLQSCSPAAVTCILRCHGCWNGWGYSACWSRQSPERRGCQIWECTGCPGRRTGMAYTGCTEIQNLETMGSRFQVGKQWCRWTSASDYQPVRAAASLAPIYHWWELSGHCRSHSQLSRNIFSAVDLAGRAQHARCCPSRMCCEGERRSPWLTESWRRGPWPGRGVCGSLDAARSPPLPRSQICGTCLSGRARGCCHSDGQT